LVVRDDYVAVHDLNSKNGTWVNDEPVVSERQLFSGDKLGLGMCFFEVLIDPATGHSRRIEESSPVPLSDRAHLAGDAPEVLPVRSVG
jgi:pSer/pThr/pTyr-binding forkhead associated (FHA) protein